MTQEEINVLKKALNLIRPVITVKAWTFKDENGETIDDWFIEGTKDKDLSEEEYNTIMLAFKLSKSK